MTSIALPRAAARSRVRGLRIDPPVLAVLGLAAALCLWNLTISGYSNDYYAAAAKAGSVSWKAWFFGALDPGSFITVDKPPLSLWLSGLSARALGFSSLSILLPQALCTIAAVGLLHATVRRTFGRTAALIAATALAITPVTVAIGRVNNPDALLVLLLVAAGYLLVRALESGRTRHLAWCGAIVGLAFMTKMLQGWMIVPALGAAYLAAGPPRLGVRIRQLAIAAAAMVAVSAAWPLAVSLWPGSRPYIGGSTDGSVWNLILGYNGVGRLTGNEGGMGGGGPTFGCAAWILFGVWALVHVAVFSSQRGIFHPYYVSALAPAVAALSGAGLVTLSRWARRSWTGVAVLDAALIATAWVAVHLLDRTPDFAPWLRTAIPVALAIAVFGSVALRGSRTLVVAAVAGAIVLGAGPAAYSVASVGHALDGNNVTAGPASAGAGGMPGASRTTSDQLIAYLQAHRGSAKYLVAADGSHATAPIVVRTGAAVVTIGGFSGNDPAPTVRQLAAMVSSGQLKYVLLGGDRGGPGGGGSQALTAWVKAHGTKVQGVSTNGGTLYRVSAA